MKSIIQENNNKSCVTYKDDLIDNEELIKKDPIPYITNAFLSSYTLYAAHEMQLFTLISKQPMSLQEIAAYLKIQERAAQVLLSMCGALGLLKIDNNKYILTELSTHYLLPESAYYYGTMIDFCLHDLEALSYKKFKKALLSDTSQIYDEQDLFKVHEEEKELGEFFTRAMHSKSVSAASIWPKVFDLSSYKVLLESYDGKLCMEVR